MTAEPEERRWINAGGYRSRMGRSSFLIRCPFCQGESRAFVWSVNGSGKRCETPGCDALFSGIGLARIAPRKPPRRAPAPDAIPPAHS